MKIDLNTRYAWMKLLKSFNKLDSLILKFASKNDSDADQNGVIDFQLFTSLLALNWSFYALR